ncbi:MAG: PEP-CTERM sorting domain-containing protein [Chthoniobacteraceae bacterium]
MNFKSLFLALVCTAVFPASQASATVLVNGGFEDSTGNWTMSATAASGWSTTAGDHQMEIWSNDFMSVPAYEGNYFMELNANQTATVYQDITGLTAGDLISLSFAHRGRVTEESMLVTLTDLGTDGIYGTADDVTLFSQVYTDGTSAWSYYTTGTATATGDTVRVSFESQAQGSYGNFIDAVSLNVESAAAPEPGTWAALVLLVLGSFGSSALRRKGFAGAVAR